MQGEWRKACRVVNGKLRGRDYCGNICVYLFIFILGIFREYTVFLNLKT
jgi:hypothetical protein